MYSTNLKFQQCSQNCPLQQKQNIPKIMFSFCFAQSLWSVVWQAPLSILESQNLGIFQILGLLVHRLLPSLNWWKLTHDLSCGRNTMGVNQGSSCQVNWISFFLWPVMFTWLDWHLSVDFSFVKYSLFLFCLINTLWTGISSLRLSYF